MRRLCLNWCWNLSCTATSLSKRCTRRIGAAKQRTRAPPSRRKLWQGFQKWNADTKNRFLSEGNYSYLRCGKKTPIFIAPFQFTSFLIRTNILKEFGKIPIRQKNKVELFKISFPFYIVLHILPVIIFFYTTNERIEYAVWLLYRDL